MFSRVNLFTFVSVFNGAHIFSVTSQRYYKVTVIGACGGVGQPLSMLLKMNNLVSHLALYDVAPSIYGVAVDLSHVSTRSKVTGHKGIKQLSDAIRCASLVMIPAGAPRKSGMTRDDQFKTNACMLREVCKTIAQDSPEAIISIITNPVNSTVPIAAEILKKERVYSPRRLMGVTTLDVVRTCTFIGEINCINPSRVNVPVIGGQSGLTIVPVLSQSNPPVQLCCMHDIKKLTARIQHADNAVMIAKGGCGSATLSMAFAAAKFTSSILRALNGEQNIVECAYVQTGMREPSFFAYPVLLGVCGIDRILGINPLSDYEVQLLRRAMPQLLTSIRSGEVFGSKC